jgi:hypothetical protein
MNNDMTLLPVTARPWAGASAAAPDACLPPGGPAATGAADRRLMARPRVITSDLPHRFAQEKSVLVKSGFGQQGTSVQTYINAISAAATGGSQTGSPPAWDPV